ncbi:hypothetical protein EDI_044710 [Entamoeba dispar SAW760]|uniref:Rho-GAP domain-containing protein n=1 Tax=Entamoeba dispar (strain ATCC PRA-260 / SAW760) TaxID=370354 RepID=B0EHX1_ENTDS|nr:uncharacterized protein EDI_044710 [Entamoeba dispar SAW760]EDR25915.1 hypothetical protein EDI_044710 [Entamoeba dispar SAW760]|eukprot:EDR25915.1 hypothetical protein EDI_044710 [Entamoeba dispar SAW760]
MNAENLSKVISPNIYPCDNTSLDIEKLTKTVKFMIENYDIVFRPIKTEINKLYKDGETERLKRLKFESKMLQGSLNDRDISVSRLFESTKENSVVLTLIDILRQGEAEIEEGKKVYKRWVVLKSKTMMLFKEKGQAKAEIVIPLLECFVTETMKGTVINISLNEKHYYSITFINNHKKWVKLIKSCLKPDSK